MNQTFKSQIKDLDQMNFYSCCKSTLLVVFETKIGMYC
uniref:Uncharacterized protein n=1 Tax=Rhizophora mucronata TaxID=61149 RepID=A0A2P2PKG6_RHIMU